MLIAILYLIEVPTKVIVLTQCRLTRARAFAFFYKAVAAELVIE